MHLKKLIAMGLATILMCIPITIHAENIVDNPAYVNEINFGDIADTPTETENMIPGDSTVDNNAEITINEVQSSNFSNEISFQETEPSAESSEISFDDEESSEINLTEEDEGEDIILTFGLTAAGTENDIERFRTGWKNTDEGKQYILSDGTFATGIVTIDDNLYLFDDKGIAASGWTEYNGEKVYAFLDGLLAVGMVDIGDDMYLFNSQGSLMTGWARFDGSLYYTGDDGVLRTGWFETDGNKYLAMDDGKILSGWIIYGERTYYQTELGVLTGIQDVDGETMIFGEDGALVNGAVMINGQRYLADEGGVACHGWVETPEGRMYADANGRLMEGWQTIDGKKYYFDKGVMATHFWRINGVTYVFDDEGQMVCDFKSSVSPTVPAFSRSSETDENISVRYEDIIYEGDIPDRSKINVDDVSSFGETSDINLVMEGGSWDEEAYGTVSLPVSTSAGSNIINIQAIPVDHIEAVYNGILYPGDTPLVQNITVTAVYEDGTKKPVQDFTCDLPKTIKEDTLVKIVSDYGNLDMILDVAEADTLYATYAGSVREGDMLNPDNITAWTATNDGKRLYAGTVRTAPIRIFNDEDVTVSADGVETKCHIHCSKIMKITVAGSIHSGDALSGRNLIVRYADGSTGTWYPDDYKWTDLMPMAKEGTSTRKIEYLGHQYDVTINAQKRAFGEQSSEFNPWINTEAYPGATGVYANAGSYGYSSRTSLGIWTLTAYADTPEDQGPYVGQTASGASLVEGRTVAVSKATMDRLGLVFGDKLEINGHVYTIEDHGGSAMENKDWVDIFVSDPAHVYDAAYNTPSEVFLLR